MTRARAAVLLLGALALGARGVGAPPARQGSEGAQAAPAALASGDAERARAAGRALAQLGAEGVTRVCAGFEAAPPAERRARARWLLEHAPAAEAGSRGATAVWLGGALADPDAEVRALLVRGAGRLELDDAAARARAQRLAALAVEEADARVRAALVAALEEAADAPAAAVLDGLLDPWPGEEAVRAARALAAVSAGAPHVLARVQGAFDRDGAGDALDAGLLAALLPAYGTRLAEREEGGDVARERAPFVLGRAHPSAAVRAAAALALDRLLERLRELDASARADRLLAALVAEAVAPEELLLRRAVHALQAGLAPATAREAARALGRAAQTVPPPRASAWRWRAAYLEGMAALAAGEDAAAAEPLARAAAELDAALAERADLAREPGPRERGRMERPSLAGAARQQELLHERALVELAQAVRAFAGGDSERDLGLLRHLRRAHALELEAQVLAAGAGEAELRTLDGLLEAGLSPERLLFGRSPHAAWPVERCLEVRRRLGAALASVAPRELVGFEPVEGLAPELADPLADGERRALLEGVLDARLEALFRRWSELQGRELSGRDALDELERAELERIGRWIAIERELDRRARAEGKARAEARHRELRSPCTLARSLAIELREQGRPAEARALMQAMIAKLEEDGSDNALLVAQARVTLAGSWTDEGEGAKAQAELERAVALFEAFETQALERGDELRAAVARSLLSGALVSLAVNANVKLRDPDAALAYFERAFALQQDDFMQVLHACYLARSGRGEEARAALTAVPHVPRHAYNLACTYALLGERELALEQLERDFEENHAGPGSRARQRAWARDDPDLASLRGDPTFEYLVGR